MTDLSKVFDCLSCELITVTLNAYEFGFNSLKLIKNYLSHRKQKTKINHSYSSWGEVLFGVSQGSMLGPLSPPIVV